MSVTPYFRIAIARAKEMLGAVEAAVAQWREQGRALGLTAVDLDQLADAFEHHERAAARRAIG
jgi:serine/threonine-protein kinase HipA